MEAARRFLKVYANRNRHLFDFANLGIPEEEDFISVIGRSHDSAAGPDGIPYSAYKAIKFLAARILADTTRCLSDPAVCDKFDVVSLNRQLVWFAPKGVEDEDGATCTRTPEDLRTVFGSNTDVKLISSAVAVKITPATLAVTPDIQRGFCRGRQLAMNVVDLDAYTRVYNQKCDLGESMYPSDVSTLPCTALYDFSNAFPTLNHGWLFLVLECLGWPSCLVTLVRVLYSNVHAFSSGLGNGLFLFAVECGVITGNPASSVLFLLGANPFVDLFKYLSDGPSLSVTRVCADDFGSALAALRTVKIQASIFNLAKRVTGLKLKPSKCVLIVSCVPLSKGLESSIRNWLREHVPELVDFKIKSSGKYLGWILGVDSCKRSYEAPLAKFRDRVLEVCSGDAPSTVAILRYNQRAVTVLSYVAQFSPPPCERSIAELSHNAVHKVLRLPPKSMSRSLVHSIAFCTAVDPIFLPHYCAAILYRFAASERDAIFTLRDNIMSLLGDDMLLQDVASFTVPRGGCGSKAILQNLLDALGLCGPLKVARVRAACSVESRWLLSYPTSPLPSKAKSLQSAVLEVLRPAIHCTDLSLAVSKKAAVSLGDEESSRIRLRRDWFFVLLPILESVKIFLRVCWLKTICGGWCTTYRMNENIKWPCIFGCTDSKDELRHYLMCPILWQYASENLGGVASVFMEGRLCLVDPSKESLRALAFVHSLYHCCKNDPDCIRHDGHICEPRVVQARASQLSRYVKHLVSF